MSRVKEGDMLRVENYHPDFDGKSGEVISVIGNYVKLWFHWGRLIEIHIKYTSAVSEDTLW